MSNAASLYRMATSDHLCPYGLKAKALLQARGFEVDDHLLRSRDEIDAFKREHHVETTPQVFINGERVGGYDALRERFGLFSKSAKDDTTYQPIIALFTMSLLMAVAASYVASGTIFSLRTFEWFIAFSMCLLAVQKLRDLEAFSTQFLGYDLLARRYVAYAYLYPFGEALAGIGMIAQTAIWLVAPIAIFIGAVGAVSVIKAVYIDKRELKCACVGGDSNVPLGAISLTENVMTLAMGIWMLIKPLVL